MKNIQVYLVNKGAPAAGFSLGTFLDDPGGGTGSAATEQWVNDFYYGLVAPIKKYLPTGLVSGTDESETASDVMDSLEYMAGVKNENTLEYDNTTNYAQDDHVMYLGMQFVSLIAGNLGNDPIDTPAKWLPCFNREDAMVKYQKGDDIKGGFDPLHDYRDALYRQLFLWGKYNYGGDSTSGAGRNFQGTGVHLDGTVITGDATLVALFDVGGGNEYPLLDIIAPDVLGTRTLIDSRGRVPRIVDAVAGDTGDVGDVQEDQFQGHWHERWHLDQVVTDGVAATIARNIIASAPLVKTRDDIVRDPVTDTVNGIPLTGSETVMKNFTVGVTSIMVFQEIP